MKSTKSILGFTRWLCRIGQLLVWICAAANIVVLSLTAKMSLDTLTGEKSASNEVLSKMLGSFPQSESVVDTIYLSVAVNSLTILAAAILASGLLAIAITNIDLRNMTAHRFSRRSASV